MTTHHFLDEEDICANFARHPDSQGYTETDFKAVLSDLLAQGPRSAGSVLRR
jgi:hypothetical protein